MGREKLSNLEILSNIFIKRRVTLSCLNSQQNKNCKDFSITIHTMNYPVAFVDTETKMAEAYSPKVLKGRLAHPKNIAKKIVGEYNEVLNTLRRHNYSIEFLEFPFQMKHNNH